MKRLPLWIYLILIWVVAAAYFIPQGYHYFRQWDESPQQLKDTLRSQSSIGSIDLNSEEFTQRDSSLWASHFLYPQPGLNPLFLHLVDPDCTAIKSWAQKDLGEEARKTLQWLRYQYITTENGRAEIIKGLEEYLVKHAAERPSKDKGAQIIRELDERLANREISLAQKVAAVAFVTAEACAVTAQIRSNLARAENASR